MHHVRLDDPSVDAVFAAAALRRRVVFVHCGVLSVGVRKKLGLPSRFDVRLGDHLNGFIAKGKVETWAEAEAWLREQALAHFPDSKFAQDELREAQGSLAAEQ